MESPATIADALHHARESQPRRQRSRLSNEALSQLLDAATGQNWRVRHSDESHAASVVGALAAIIFAAIISAGLLIPVVIAFLIMSPKRVKETATLTIPTTAGTIQSDATVIRSRKRAARDALDLAIQRFIKENNSATAETTTGSKYTSP